MGSVRSRRFITFAILSLAGGDAAGSQYGDGSGHHSPGDRGVAAGRTRRSGGGGGCDRYPGVGALVDPVPPHRPRVAGRGSVGGGRCGVAGRVPEPAGRVASGGCFLGSGGGGRRGAGSRRAGIRAFRCDGRGVGHGAPRHPAGLPHRPSRTSRRGGHPDTHRGGHQRHSRRGGRTPGQRRRAGPDEVVLLLESGKPGRGHLEHGVGDAGVRAPGDSPASSAEPPTQRPPTRRRASPPFPGWT